MENILLAEAEKPKKSLIENQEKFTKFLNRGESPCDYERQLLRKHEKRINAIFQGEIVPPYEVEIQPSSFCNLNCKHCFGKSLTSKKIENKIGKKEIHTIAKSIDDFKENGFKIENVKFCGTTGEPLVNPISLYAIPLFKGLGKKVIYFTNGLELDKKFENKPYRDYILEADELRLSLDCGSEKTFEEMKGKQGFDRTTKNLESLLEKKAQTKSNLRVIIGYVIGRKNYNEIVKTTSLMNNLGVDEIRFRVDFTDPDGVHKLSDEINYGLNKAKNQTKGNLRVLSVYSNKEIKEEHIFHVDERKCFNQHFWACVGPDCNLYACGHRTYYEVEPYGSLLENSFRELWTGEKRKQNLKNLPDEYCKFCSPSSIRTNDFMTFLESLR